MHRHGVLRVLLLLVATTACGSKEPPRAEPPPNASASPVADDPNRKLTQAECESLSSEMVDACEKRGDSRSAQIEGWCRDVTHGASNGTWIAQKCLPHIRFIDATCFHGATNVTSLMDCESSVTH